MSSAINLRNKVTNNHNLAKLLKDFNNKLIVFKIIEIYQDIFESTMLDNKILIYSIDECKVVVIILNEPLEDDTDEHSIPFLSQIDFFNFTFELRCEVITKNIDHQGKCSTKVYSRHGGEFKSYWYQHR